VICAFSLVWLACGRGRRLSPVAPEDPTPTATSTATPAPTATPVPASSCSLPSLTPAPGMVCDHAKPAMLRIVEDAVEATRLERPADYPWEACCGYRLTEAQLDGFFARVIEKIGATGQYCARRDLFELAIKWSNESNEQYQFWVSSGHIRLGQKAYRATCTPAWF
jgi:hypothetical protein